MTKILVFTALMTVIAPLAAQAETEIDPGSCMARIFLVDIHPEYEPKIRQIIEEKGYIDFLKTERRPGDYFSPPLTVLVKLNYNLSVPTSNSVTIRYLETVPLIDHPPIFEATYFEDSNWTVGKSTDKACEATMELVRSLPKCMGFDSPLRK